ncbi:MucB/RseB C-terminal domain-containing protein [Ferrimonas gelatinilytica]|uniref:MucB/RseB C-terminal domain-containing protein n=1 Tax=Ferrimonas gelatinilytica TaxID=1255257 RepID=A0ABP9S8A9_9GAMM
MLRLFLIGLALFGLPALQAAEGTSGELVSADADSGELAALPWLVRMEHALNHANFQLSMVQMQRDQIRSLRYLHGVMPEGQVALLEHLNGPVKNAIRIHNTVAFLEHDVQPYSVRSDRIPGLFPGVFAGGINGLEAHYRFVEGGRNRVAGRTAQLVRIVPADQYRFQYRVWLDIDTALPLRVDTLDPDNTLLEQLLVIELHQFDKAPPLLEELSQRSWPEVLEAPRSTFELRWRFGWLPKGFTVTHYDQHRLLGLNEPVDYIALSDGLAEFSVYIGRAGRVDLPDGLTTSNGLAMATAQHGEVEVVAVGKVPLSALVNVVENIYPAEQP